MSQNESGTAGSPGSGPGDAGDDAGVGGGRAPDHPIDDEDGAGGGGNPALGRGNDGGVDSSVDPGEAFDKAAAQVIDDVYELRLTALFRQLVRTRGHKGAARVLGLDPRTVAGSVQQGMSRRVR